MENAKIPNPGSLSLNLDQQNGFPQDQQNKKASRTQMKGEHMDEKGGNVNEINEEISRMLQTDDHNLQVVADNSATTATVGIQEI